MKSTPHADAQAFRRRWRQVNEAEKRELRRTLISQKARQLASMMAVARELGWTPQLAAEEEVTRRVWRRLRERHWQARS